MRKPLHARRLKLGNPKHSYTFFSTRSVVLILFSMLVFQLQYTYGQCTPTSGTIEGTVFMDLDYDGLYGPDEVGADVGEVEVYDADGQLVESTVPSSNGYYQVSGLTDGQDYIVLHRLPIHLSPAITGADHQSEVRRVEAPSCDVRFGAVDPTLYCDSENPSIAVTCFVKGDDGVNEDMETVVYTDFLFNTNTNISKIAVKGETGSVFGSAWSSSDQTLYSSTFVKQDAFVKDDLGTIYQSKQVNGQYETNKWVSLTDLGIDVGSLSIQDANSCDYGAQVGKFGIGGMEISPDEEYMYAVNLFNKSIVIIDRLDPSPATTMEVPITSVSCNGGEMRPFGISYHDGLYYVTATCDASVSQSSDDHTITVLTFDPVTKIFSEALSTNFSKNYWRDFPSDNNTIGHWLMDIDFTADGHMILGVADRSSHRYCHSRLVLQNQYPDILMAWNDNGVWRLENNGQVAGLTGSGVGNGQGPGGGEFFGEDFWILGPLYHPETATGTVYCLPGSNEVVATVFDPLYNTFAGGFHRYDGRNGKKLAAIELFNNANPAAFGKGSGLGKIVDMCGAAPQEIGNYVWFDTDMNGVQDTDEAAVDGLELTLYNDLCEVVATTVTNDGYYYFSAGIEPHSTYYVAISDSRWNATEGSIEMGGEVYHITVLDAAGDQRDSDIQEMDLPCQSGLWAVEVNTSGPGFSNHSFDIGLALRNLM